MQLRGRESTAMSDWAASHSSLLTVTGPAGVGKSWLARRFLEAHGSDFDRTAWVALATASEAGEVRVAVAAALGLESLEPDRFGAGLGTVGSLLVVLDGLDGVDDAASMLEAWGSHAPEARFVVTSRRRPRVRGAAVLELAPWVMPRPDASVAALRASGPLQLFVQWARVYRPGVGSGVDELRALAEVGRHLDGLPLGMELVVPRLSVMSPAELLLSAVAGRGGTLAETLRDSWNRLGAEARRALVQATVFRGGFDLAAARACIETDGDLVQALHDLAEASMLQVERGKSTRFRMLRSVARLAASDGTVVDPTRHRRYYGALARRSLGPTRCPTAEAEAQLVVERDNLAAVAAGSGPAAAHATLALCKVLPRLGQAERCGRWVAKALSDGALDDDLRADLWLARASLAYDVGRHDDALTFAQRGVEAAGDGAGLPRAVVSLGAILYRAGRREEALERLERGRDLAEASTDVLALSNALRWSAWIRFRGGADGGVEVDLRHSLRLVRQAGLERATGGALANLGMYLVHMARAVEARSVLERAAAVQRKLDDTAGLGRTVFLLGELCADTGDLQQSIAHYLEAVDRFRATGRREEEGYALVGLGTAVLLQGDPQGAVRDLQDALFLAEDATSPNLLAHCHERLGQAQWVWGHHAAAIRSLREAAEGFEGIGERKRFGLVAGWLGFAETHAGDPQQASHWCEASDAALSAAPEPVYRTAVDVLRGDGGGGDAVEVALAKRARCRSEPRSSSAPPGLVLHGVERRVTLPDGTEVDLSRRRKLWRLLDFLAAAHERGADTVETTELVEYLWPGERLVPESAAQRIYTTVFYLRKMGFESVLARTATGYRLKAGLRVQRISDEI